MISRSDISRRLEEWLDIALGEEAPPPGIPSEILNGAENGEGSSPTDLHALWAALTALTQEVRLQGRAFKQMSETLVRDTERRSRKEMLDALLEVRERLLRGLESLCAREDLRPGFWGRIFRNRWRQIQRQLEVVRALEEGYRLSLNHLDDLLDQFQVRAIQCEGQPFDPRSMRAVDVEETNQLNDGIVLSVYRNGYEWNGELYRPAQVRVARTPKEAVINE